MDWVGCYHIHPRKTPAISGGRPILSVSVLSQLLAAQTLECVPQTIASIFTLCSYAQSQTSALALATAQSGQASLLTMGQKQQLRWHTLRDHIQQIASIWYGSSIELRHEINWSSCPLLSSTNMEFVDEDALKQWFTQYLLGIDVGSWWGNWLENGVDWLHTWTEKSDLCSAKICRERLFLRDWAQGGQTLPIDAQVLNMLWQQWQSQDAFAQQPQIEGVVYESGAWSRKNAAHALNQDAWTRGCAVLVDAIALLMDDEANYLQSGVMPIAPYGAVAWVEMTRGILMHFVQMDETTQRILRYGILAPTEWNFHPHGRLAHAIAEHNHADSAQMMALVAAFDPCVAVKIENDYA